MSNQYVNRVVQSDGTVLMDISDSTATASEIKEGYTGYTSTGEKVVGTLSFITYYTGTTDPPSLLGNDGDIYLKVVS